jgi:Patatin-like phospholipase
MSYFVAVLPVVLLVLLGVWGAWMNKACAFKPLRKPFWPQAENPGLALELAASADDVNRVLGDPSSGERKENRDTAVRLQKFDFVFIPLYVLLFSVAAFANGGLAGARIVIGLALVTGIFDVLEDLQIIALANARPGSARRYGKLKWLFYFGTVAAEGGLFVWPRFDPIKIGFGVLLLAVGLGGSLPALRGSFGGILSGAKISILALVGLAVAPLVPFMPVPIHEIAEYAVLMRVPLLTAGLLVALPFLAFSTGARSLLRGLFDLTPLSLFVVTLTTFALAGTACMTSYLILAHASERMGIVHESVHSLPPAWFWVFLVVVLSLPVVLSAFVFSSRHRPGYVRFLCALGAGTVLSAMAVAALFEFRHALGPSILPAEWSHRVESWLADTHWFAGYVAPGSSVDPWQDHLRATYGLLCTLVLYVLVGVYGWSRIGKSGTVPALSSALMLAMMLSWTLSGVSFFFDAWHIPTILIIGLVGVLTAQSTQSDHYYHLKSRPATNRDAALPQETLCAGSQERVVVVAANGGGIQAAAWSAQVLYGLHENSKTQFEQSLRMISSVSGGSVGNAIFVNWLDDKNAKAPPDAAACSSLDEVAWGLAWPDFLRALCPWVFRKLIGRGRVLEKAWCLSSEGPQQRAGHLDALLSGWNQKVSSAKLPAVVLNATIAETGDRLLLATTRMQRNSNAHTAGVDAADLHTINKERRDVGIVTAARLSATFPYVTPASRSDGPGPQPHIVDGGYYDNYGMATLVEWLDQALMGANGKIKSVLVVQIHGSPVNSDPRSVQLETKNRGWFYQALAPLLTLAAVRSAGQVAHNDIELGLLQDKWSGLGVPVHSVTFEFPKNDTPLSWHLTAQEVTSIKSEWDDAAMKPQKKRVKKFLEGSDQLDCGCSCCAVAKSQQPAVPSKVASSSPTS